MSSLMWVFCLLEIWSCLSYLQVYSKSGSVYTVVLVVTVTCRYGSMPTQFHWECPILWPPWFGFLSRRRCTLLWSWSLIPFNRSIQCRSWLRHCATSQMVAGSILDGVTSSGRTMTLRSTQPLTEMSTRKISCGVKEAGALGWQCYHLNVPTVLKSWSLNLLEPSGPVQAFTGFALPTKISWNSAQTWAQATQISVRIGLCH